MTLAHRLAPALVLAFALSVPAAARADIPPADGGSTGGSASTSGSGGSGGGSAYCDVSSQEESGTTCQLCMATAGDTQSCQDELGMNYTFACQSTATDQVWCDGPARYQMASTGCALGAAPERVGGVAFTMLMALALYAGRRRKQGA